jgi:PTH1 family peptidyl-tRNA hydrolase
MFLIFGLGNPGRQYDGTRHNMGFEAVDLFAKRHGFKIKATKFEAYAAEDFFAGNKLVLVKPTAFMNLSGTVVNKFTRYYKMPPEDWAERLIVIYDDTDLEPGQIRIRRRGSAGGHNGMKNILYHLETEDFMRIRIGVGRRPEGMDQCSHVLSRFSKTQEDAAIQGIITATDALEDLIRHGSTFTMNKYNAKPAPPKEPEETEVNPDTNPQPLTSNF